MERGCHHARAATFYWIDPRRQPGWFSARSSSSSSPNSSPAFDPIQYPRRYPLNRLPFLKIQGRSPHHLCSLRFRFINHSQYFLIPLGSIRQLPGEREQIAGSGLKDVWTDGVSAIAWPMKVWVDPAAHNGDGWDTGFHEWDVIATGEKTEEIELVCDPNCLSRVERQALLESCHTDRQSPISDPCVVDIDHGFGRANQRHQPFEIETRSDESLFFPTKCNEEDSPFASYA